MAAQKFCLCVIITVASELFCQRLILAYYTRSGFWFLWARVTELHDYPLFKNVFWGIFCHSCMFNVRNPMRDTGGTLFKDPMHFQVFFTLSHSLTYRILEVPRPIACAWCHLGPLLTAGNVRNPPPCFFCGSFWFLNGQNCYQEKKVSLKILQK